MIVKILKKKIMIIIMIIKTQKSFGILLCSYLKSLKDPSLNKSLQSNLKIELNNSVRND